MNSQIMHSFPPAQCRTDDEFGVFAAARNILRPLNANSLLLTFLSGISPVT